jgi:hypothetical protein
MWVVKPDGSNAVKLVAGVSGHGCIISPNQSFLACEACIPACTAASRVIDIDLYSIEHKPDGSVEAKFRAHLVALANASLPTGSKEAVLMLAGTWSPDSDYLVYFGMRGPTGTGKLIYQSVKDLDHLGSSANHYILSDGNEPGFACANGDECGKLGVDKPYDKVGSDYPAFSPLISGQKHPKWLAVVMRTPLTHPTGTQKYRRYFCGLNMSSKHPTCDTGIQITCSNDVQSPTFSPDGKSIAFLSVANSEDSRTQVFVASWASSAKCKQMTRISAEHEAYLPRWGD